MSDFLIWYGARLGLGAMMILGLGAIPAPAQPPEMRAVWISRFEWPNVEEVTAKATIDTMMQTLADNNFNTVFFQVRGQCDVHYPSPDEPWSNTYGWTHPGWDPLAYAIDSARSRGLEFHAYFNTHTLAAPVPPANTVPQHPFNLHGPTAPGEQSWMIRNSGGVAGLVDSYYWISPANTEASAWTRKQALYLAKNYPVDGLHFDRIRSPGNTYTFDAATQRRWNSGQISDSNPDGLDLADFMRSQITRDLRNIQGALLHWNFTHPERPIIKTSAAPFGIVYKDANTLYQGTGTQSYHSWYQDSWGWLRYGTLDFMVPQIYWQVGSAHPFELLLADWLNNSHGRHVVAGSTTSGGGKTAFNLLREHLETRTQSAAGHTIFSFNSMGNYWAPFLSAGATGVPNISAPYDQPTTTPEMPWRTQPTSATIVGTVVDSLGHPVVDARIILPGDIYRNPQGGPYNYLSAHDGFFAILGVTPGSGHQVQVSRTSHTTITVPLSPLAAGEVTSLTVVLPSQAGLLGQLLFEPTTYYVSSTATLKLNDGDLAGLGTVQVQVTSLRETTPEMVTLAETVTSSGLFQGSFPLSPGPLVAQDGILQTQNGDVLTAAYLDSNGGGGTSTTLLTTALVLLLDHLVLESRTSTGGLTPAPTYVETAGFPGVWANTTAKSGAPGLTGQGARWIGNAGLGSTATYRTIIPVGGSYDLAVTLPNSITGPNNHSPGVTWSITHAGPGGITTGAVDLSRTNALLTDKWLVLASNVPLPPAFEVRVTFTNNHAGSANTGNRFDMDAIRLSLVSLPVTLTDWTVE